MRRQQETTPQQGEQKQQQQQPQPQRILTPYNIMRLQNCKSFKFRKTEMYPSIRPAVSQCNPAQTIAMLSDTMEAYDCGSIDATLLDQTKQSPYADLLPKGTKNESQIEYPCRDKKRRLHGQVLEDPQMAEEWSKFTPYELIRMHNCKSHIYQKSETYPSIRPPVYRCSVAKTAEALVDALEDNCCGRLFDMEHDDIMEVWKQSPNKNTLSFYGIGDGIPEPEAILFNKVISKCLSKVNTPKPKREEIPKPKMPRLPQVSRPCGGLVLNRPLLAVKISKMPTVRTKLNAREALKYLHGPHPAIDPALPFIDELPKLKVPKAGPKTTPSLRRKYPICDLKCGIPENKCTEFEWKKYKGDPRLYDEAFKQELEEMEEEIEPEPKNYDELFEELITCFEKDKSIDPMCEIYKICCRKPTQEDGQEDDGGAGHGGAGGRGKGGPGGKKPHKPHDGGESGNGKDPNKPGWTDKDKTTGKDKTGKDKTDKEKELDKDKDRQDKNDINQDKSEMSDKDKPGRDKFGKDKPSRDKTGTGKDKDNDKDETDKEKSDKDRPGKDIPGKERPDKDKSDKDKPDKDKPDKDKSDKDKPEKEKSEKDTQDKGKPTKDKFGKDIDNLSDTEKPAKNKGKGKDKDKTDKDKSKTTGSEGDNSTDKSKNKWPGIGSDEDDTVKDHKSDGTTSHKAPTSEAPTEEKSAEDSDIPVSGYKKPPKKPKPFDKGNRPINKGDKPPNKADTFHKPHLPKLHGQDTDKSAKPEGDKESHRDCPCDVCKFMKRRVQETDSPLIREMKRKEKRRQLLDYYKQMCHRQNAKCAAPEYRAPLHKCDPIECDNTFCTNPKLAEYSDCLGAMQELQKLLGPKHRIVNNELRFNLDDLKSRICRRFCECL